MVSTVSDSRRRQPHGHETGFPEPLTTRRDGRRHHLRVVPAGNQRTDLTNSADRMTASTEPAAVHQATRLGSAGRPRGGREHADADVSLCVGAASAVTARPRAVSAIRSIRRAVAAVGAVAPVVPPCHLARSGWRQPVAQAWAEGRCRRRSLLVPCRPVYRRRDARRVCFAQARCGLSAPGAVR
jgi:hypothetical protein